MDKKKQFSANWKRMLELQALLEKVNYQMLGESTETKSLYEDLRHRTVTELKQLNEAQKILAQDSKKNND